MKCPKCLQWKQTVYSLTTHASVLILKLMFKSKETESCEESVALHSPGCILFLFFKLFIYSKEKLWTINVYWTDQEGVDEQVGTLNGSLCHQCVNL